MVEIYKYENFAGVPTFVILDNFMFIELASNKIDKDMYYNVPSEDEVKLRTILSWLNTREMIEYIESPKFNDADLYLLLRTKVASNKDISNWWKLYNFKLYIYPYFKYM